MQKIKKNRFISFFLFGIILILLFTITVFAARLPGDMDGDGKITAADARIILRISAKLEKIEDYISDTDIKDISQDDKKNGEVDDSDFDIKGYLYNNQSSSYYYLVIKNNSSTTVAVSGNAIAKDSTGKAIGAGDLSIDAIGPGQTSIGYCFFNKVSGISSVEYSLNYRTDYYYDDVLADLTVKESINNSNVIVSATNNGNKAASFVRAYALFFDNTGKVVGTDTRYIIDNNNELKPGVTLSAQLDARQEFDRVEVYLTGRRSR